MKLKMLSLVFLSSTAFAKGQLECKKMRELIKSQGKEIFDKPSEEAIIAASKIHEVSPEIAKCVYPALTYMPKKIGEYEDIQDGANGPSIVTISNRGIYKWENWELQVGIIHAPSGFKVGTELWIDGKRRSMKVYAVSNKNEVEKTS